MEELITTENEVTVTLKFDLEKYPDIKIFLLNLDSLGSEFDFKIV